MNWIEKVRFLKTEKERVGYTSPYMLDIDYIPSSWSPHEFQHLKDHYPWLPNSYLSFIEEFDNLGLAWVTFYGSEAGKIIPLIKEIDYWKEEGLPDEYFPFGKGPGGEVYVFNHLGIVIEFPCDDYSFEHPRIVANNLEEFVGECLLGKNYSKFESIENNKFYPFLKTQGWVD
jgi:hypothetical protein